VEKAKILLNLPSARVRLTCITLSEEREGNRKLIFSGIEKAALDFGSAGR